MSNKYPLLTVENVRYWYWTHDPQMSGHDIAKKVGCYFQKVYEFMEKNSIPIRSYVDASKALYRDPKKYGKYMKARMSPEYLRKQSESHKKLWENNPELRQQRSELLKELYKRKLTKPQKVVLFTLRDRRGNFVGELEEKTSLTKGLLYRTVSYLRNRGLVSLIKKHDPKRNPKRIYSKYYITQKGLESIDFNLKNDPFNFDELIREVKNQQTKDPALAEANKSFLGKNQKILLKVLSSGNSFFAKELALITHLKKVGKSLYNLYNRGIVGRKKEIDLSATGNNNKAYKYFLTETGTSLLNKSRREVDLEMVVSEV